MCVYNCGKNANKPMKKLTRSTACAIPSPRTFNDVQLPYGEDRATKKLVHITKIKTDSLYRCPCCKKPLTPKRGNQLEWHFAHKAKHGCSGDARETAIHRRGKEILIESGAVCFTHYATSQIRLHFTDARDEHSVLTSNRERRVDVTALHHPLNQGPKRQLYFEICVTNPVSEQKLSELQDLGVSTLEINLGDFYKKAGWTDEDLNEAVVASAPRQWLVMSDDIEALIEDHQERCPVYDEHLKREAEFNEDLQEMQEEIRARNLRIQLTIREGVAALLAETNENQRQQLHALLQSKDRPKKNSDINTLLGCTKKGQFFRSLRIAGLVTEDETSHDQPDSEWGCWPESFEYGTVSLWYFNAAVLAWQTLRTSQKDKKNQAISASEALQRLLQW
jgi:hypothetical protein